VNRNGDALLLAVIVTKVCFVVPAAQVSVQGDAVVPLVLLLQ
jgi:hypothetical protein